MAVERRSRSFWKRLVAEVERGSTIARIAERHGVRPKTLAWWRWTLRREGDARVTNAQLLPVVFSGGPSPAISGEGGIAIEVRDVSFRVPLGSDVSYVAALVAAVRATC